MRARRSGDPGRGAEVVWTPTVEQVARIEDAARSREAFGSQRERDAAAEQRGGASGGGAVERYAAPQVYGQVEVLGALGTSMDKRGSGALEVRERGVILQPEGPRGASRAGWRYEVTLPDGSTREGTLDGEGRAVIEDVPPGSISNERYSPPE